MMLPAINPVSIDAIESAKIRQSTLTKPAGALGFLEDISIQLCGIAGLCPPPEFKNAAVVVFAGDHGVVKEGVTAWSSEITFQMLANFASGGAAINVLANYVGAQLLVVDVGVEKDSGEIKNVIHKNVRHGTGNIRFEDAMSEAEFREAIGVGIEISNKLAEQGCEIFVAGDMGIGNTTPAAAIIAALTGSDAKDVTGRGTGIGDEMFSKKVAVVDEALSRFRSNTSGIYSNINNGIRAGIQLGGLEHVAMAGFMLGAASHKGVVLVDGVIAVSAALIALELNPLVKQYMFAGHLSTEPASKIGLERLGLQPILNLGMRLGEGTGGCLAIPVIQASAKILREMASFDEAGVKKEV